MHGRASAPHRRHRLRRVAHRAGAARRRPRGRRPSCATPGRPIGALARRGVDAGVVDVVVGDMLDRASIEARRRRVRRRHPRRRRHRHHERRRRSRCYEQNVGGTAQRRRRRPRRRLRPGRARVDGRRVRAADGPDHHRRRAAGVAPQRVRPLEGRGRAPAAGAPGRRARRSSIVYPGGVIGPDQPRLDAALEGIAGARKRAGRWRPAASPHRRARPRRRARRRRRAGPRARAGCCSAGRFFTWPELGDLTDELFGVRARRLPLPEAAAARRRAASSTSLRKVVPIAYPLTRDAAEIMVTMVPTDDEPSLEALGITLRPVRGDARRRAAVDRRRRPPRRQARRQAGEVAATRGSRRKTRRSRPTRST